MLWRVTFVGRAGGFVDMGEACGTASRILRQIGMDCIADSGEACKASMAKRHDTDNELRVVYRVQFEVRIGYRCIERSDLPQLTKVPTLVQTLRLASSPLVEHCQQPLFQHVFEPTNQQKATYALHGSGETYSRTSTSSARRETCCTRGCRSSRGGDHLKYRQFSGLSLCAIVDDTL